MCGAELAREYRLINMVYSFYCWPEGQGKATVACLGSCMAYFKFAWYDRRPLLMSLKLATFRGHVRLQELLEDPVVAVDGFTYSRAATKRWLRDGRSTSPTGHDQPALGTQAPDAQEHHTLYAVPVESYEEAQFP